MSSNISEDISL